MVKWCVKHRNIIILFIVSIIISGLTMYSSMERQENPSISSPVAVVKCIYKGASPEDVEKEILKPIEDEISGMSQIKTIESYAMDSVGIVKVTLKDLTDDENEKAWDDLKSHIDTAKSELPENADEPTVDSDFTSSYGLILGLSSENYTYEQLSDVANALKNEIKKDKGVAQVDINGEVGKEVKITLNMTKLQQYQVSPNTIGTALKARNINIPGGNLKMDGIKIPAQISGEYRDIEEIKNTIISASTDNGSPLYLKDVADVMLVDEEADYTSLVNNQKGLIIGVKYMDSQNIIKIQNRLDKIIENFKNDELYKEMTLTTITNQSEFVNESIGLFENNLISSIYLVVIVVFLAMGLRNSVVVSIPIPIVTCIVFIYMYMTGIPIHQVSIASLIVALGLLVDNGVVANDNISVYIDNGMTKFDACIKGVKDVLIPMLTSTLTTVASFMPLAMMNGGAGKFVKSLPILVSVALIASLITSMTVVPAMSYVFLKENDKVKKKKKRNKIQIFFDGIFNSFGKFYEGILSACLKVPRLLIAAFLGIFLLSLTLIPNILVQIFPPVERAQYVLNVTAQDGTSLESMQNTVGKVGEVLKDEESIDNFACNIGTGFMKYYITFIPSDQSTNKAQFLINGDRNKIEEVKNSIYEKVPGVSLNVKQLEISVPVAYPIQVRVSGSDVNELRRIGDEIEEKLGGIEGIANIEDDYGYSSYKLNVNVNQEKANLNGITSYEVASTVRMAVNGTEISKLKNDDINKDSYPIVLTIPAEDKNNKEMFDNLFITSSITDANVPLSQIADVTTNTSLNKIVRRNEERTITVGVFVKDGYNTANVLKECQSELKDYSVKDGYTLEYGGENESTQDTMGSMKIPFLIALAAVYVILVVQFGDFMEPFIIMGAIPLSFIGVIIGLKVMNYPIGCMSLLGAISLMGIVVNNGIVLIDNIKSLIPQYENKIEAIKRACKGRLRPIMVSTCTTIISLIPLAISGGLLWAPMACAIMFGLIVSTLLTLLFIPCGFYIVNKRKFKNHIKLQKKDINSDI